MSSDLKALLPSFVSRLFGIRETLDAISLETERLEQAVTLEYKQLSAITATDRLSDWESELSLPQRADLDQQSRRALVLAALSFFTPCSPQELIKLYSKLSGGTVQYSEYPEEYLIELSAATNGYIVANLPGIYAALSKIAPAHVYCLLKADGELASEPAAAHALSASLDLHIYTQAP